MLSSGQLSEDGEREPISPAMPEEGAYEVKYTNGRAKAQEYGTKVFEVVEYNTLKYCAYHDVEVTRNPRGVISCPKGHKLHSDLNGALNILKKATDMVILTIKNLYFSS